MKAALETCMAALFLGALGLTWLRLWVSALLGLEARWPDWALELIGDVQ